LGSLFGSFSPRGARSKGISSLTAESPTIRSPKNILGVDIGFSLPVSCAQGRLVNEIHAHEVYAYKVDVYEVHAYEIDAHEMHAYEMHVHEQAIRQIAYLICHVYTWPVIVFNVSQE
jgi:hypothetical protein